MKRAWEICNNKHIKRGIMCIPEREKENSDQTSPNLWKKKKINPYPSSSTN